MDGIENPFRGMFNPFIAAREKEKQAQLEAIEKEAELFRYMQVTILRWAGVPRLDVFVDLGDFPNAVTDTQFMKELEHTVKNYVLVSPPALNGISEYVDWLNAKQNKARACDSTVLDICFVPYIYIERNNPDKPEVAGVLIRKRSVVLVEAQPSNAYDFKMDTEVRSMIELGPRRLEHWAKQDAHRMLTAVVAEMDRLRSKSIELQESLRVFGNWQPMEKAPKDGTPILFREKPKTYHRGVVIRVADEYTVSTCYWNESDHFGIWELVHCGTNAEDSTCEPEEWMPIPKGWNAA